MPKAASDPEQYIFYPSGDRARIIDALITPDKAST